MQVAAEVETTYTDKPRKASAFGEVAVEYGFLVRHSILREESDRLGRELDVLDVGCGELLSSTGRHFETMRELARSYRGIDPSPHMVEAVNAGAISLLPDAEMTLGAGEDLPYPPESADAALLLSMLDHTVDPGLVLRQVHATLRPRGIVLITLRNAKGWYRRLARTLAPRRMARREASDHHNFGWSPATLAPLMERSGFRVVGQHDYGYLRLPHFRPDPVRPLLHVFGKRRLAEALGGAERLLGRACPGWGTTFCLVGRKHQ